MNIYFKNLLLKVIFPVVFSLVISLPSYAAASLTASIDRTKIALGEELNLSIVAEGGKIEEPEIPFSDDFDFSPSGTSSQMQIINGVYNSSETYNYRIVPKRVGKITIPAASSEIDGTRYYSEPIVVEVTQTQDTSTLDQSKSMFVLAQVNKKTAYVNEQIIYNFKFYTRVQTDLNQKNFPEFKGFWVEDMGKDNVFYQTINNQNYKIIEVNKAIYPSKSGVIEIPPTTFLVEVIYEDNNMGSIFNTTRKEVQKFITQSIKINIKDLPKAPANYSGIVSDNLKITSKLQNANIKVGDSATLEINLKGSGNLNDLKKLPLNLRNTKIYEDKSSEKSTVQANELIWDKTFKYAIVPLIKGEINIPKFPLIYFNPKKGIYENVVTSNYKLFSEAGEQVVNQNNPDNPNLTASNNDSIEDIYDNNNLTNQNISKTLILLAAFFFILTILILIYVYFISGKINLSKIENRNKHKKLIQKINSENSLDNITKLLKEYLSYKLNLNNLDEQNIKNTLDDKLLADQLINIIREYEFLKFSGQVNDLTKEKQLINDTKNIVNKIESKK